MSKGKLAKRMFEDRRRKHSHWRVTIIYHDQRVFGRVYTDRERAKRFAARQKSSPVVQRVRVTQVS
jgi:hypothetical protein